MILYPPTLPPNFVKFAVKMVYKSYIVTIFVFSCFVLFLFFVFFEFLITCFWLFSFSAYALVTLFIHCVLRAENESRRVVVYKRLDTVST